MKRHLISLALASLIASSALPASAQAPSSEPATTAEETRMLRARLERALANQSEIQRLSMSLNAHQTRMLQLDAHLQEIRHDLATFAPSLMTLRRLVAEARRESTSAPTPAARDEAADLVPVFERQLASAMQHDAQLRAEEADLARQLESEDAQWAELADRLATLTMQ